MNINARLQRAERLTAATSPDLYGGLVVLDHDAAELAFTGGVEGVNFRDFMEYYFDGRGDVARAWLWIVRAADGSITPADNARIAEFKREADVCAEWNFKTKDVELIYGLLEYYRQKGAEV